MELNKIYCMDCMEGLKELPDDSVDLIVTDPPYCINYKGSGHENRREIINDKEEDFEFIKKFMEICYYKLKEDSHIYIFTSWKVVDKWIPEFKKYFDLKNLLVIKKRHGSTGDTQGGFIYGYEMVLFGCKGRRVFEKGLKMHKNPSFERHDTRTKGFFKQRYSDFIDYYYTSEFNLELLHPTQKNIKLIRFFIQLSSKPGDLVLDCFMGSGTTAVASKQLLRQFIGFELDPHYCQIANKRLQQGVLMPETRDKTLGF